MKKLILLGLVALLLIAAAGKLTYSNVAYPDGTVGELEASVRGGRNAWTECVYYADDYLAYLGHYGEPLAAGDVLGFCLDHFADKVP